MLKLPSGSGCDTSGDESSPRMPAVMSTSSGANAHFVPNHVHNLPVAIPVSGGGPPAISRSRSGGANNGTVGNASHRKKTIHQFSFRSLVGNDILRLSDYAGKVVLIMNVASHCNSTTREYLQINELATQFPELVIIGCPCNQFGHQENLVGEEIMLSLQHIRPGKGFTPKFPLTEKLEVNGANAHAVFNFLKLSLPFPVDRTLMDEMSSPGGVFSHPMRIIWMPVSRADVSWNFEKVRPRSKERLDTRYNTNGTWCDV
jgi:glutathione peroxidase